MELTKDLYEFIENECEKFREKTNYDLNVNDILYSYLISDEEHFFIYNDWDEGKNNDPFWNEELNEHSAIVFIKQMCIKLEKLKQ